MLLELSKVSNVFSGAVQGISLVFSHYFLNNIDV